jgi:hypothetical protein
MVFKKWFFILLSAFLLTPPVFATHNQNSNYKPYKGVGLILTGGAVVIVSTLNQLGKKGTGNIGSKVAFLSSLALGSMAIGYGTKYI